MGTLSLRNCMPLQSTYWVSSTSRKSFIGTWVRDNNFGTRANRHLVSKAYIHPLAGVHLQNGTSATEFLDTEQVKTPAKAGYNQFLKKDKEDSTLTIVVVGATGNLARNKIFPALFALYYEDRLPQHFTILGYARTLMTDHELRNLISKNLTCRVIKRDNCGDMMSEFLKCCFYQSGQYSSEEHFMELNKKLEEREAGRIPNRLFYLAIPSNMFANVARCTKHRSSSKSGWTRLIVEKLFGHDIESSKKQTIALRQYLTEDQIFRIDHHVGEELVENLLVLRFSNLVFEPLWSRNYIRNIQVVFCEDFGMEGQSSFDNYGIIRDIMQSHLLQTTSLFAMETPLTLGSEDIRNEKVKVLRSMRPIKLEDVVVGQYKRNSDGNMAYPAYADEPSVLNDRLTPTFAAATLFIDNARWEGVPILLVAGKGLHSIRTEIRVQFRHVPGNLYNRKFGTDLNKTTNELVLRDKPDQAIYLKINNKVPGLGMRIDRSDLHLLYNSRHSTEIPDAYERMLLDAIEGEQRFFIRSDELDAAWAVISPLLTELEKQKVVPELYTYGSGGPIGVHYLAAKHNIRWEDFGYED